MTWLPSWLVSSQATSAVQQQASPSDGDTKICIAVDGSAASQHAFDWTLKRFTNKKDEVHLVSIVTPTASFTPGPAIPMWLEPREEQLRHADAVLEHYAQAAASAGLSSIKPVRLVTQHGASEDVGRALQHYVNANNIDTVILGSRGLSAVSSAVMKFVGLGSVSQWCVNHLNCTVVVHKAKH